MESESGSSDEDFEDNEATISSQLRGHNIHSVDFSSEAFRSLPAEVQHEILLELKDTRKQNSWNRVHQMPKVFKFYEVRRACFKGHLFMLNVI